jgi:hypothetical protein
MFEYQITEDWRNIIEITESVEKRKPQESLSNKIDGWNGKSCQDEDEE